ncbi:CapA family protein [uncultured Holdemanella sp.]|uniref:CapA family protein n=1 Tax=uncultured Holdemanella sp. TaxID=1763549 RepID=UPI0025E98D6D|nr:CapA family protein [uncultured Holdemanella sp.]
MAQNKRRRRRRMRKRTRNRLILAGGILVVLFILYLFIHFIVGLFSSPEPEKNTGTKQETKKSETTVVSFMGVGDNLIHETVYNDALQDDGTYDFSKMYTNFKKDAKESDIAFINQETVLGGESLGLSGYPTFNSPTEIAKNLEKAGFNLANLATNHCLDRGEQGITNELEAFSNTNIVTDGVYTSQEAFNAIPTFKKKGITFSFLAYTYGTNGIAPDYDYNVSYLDDDQIKSDVQKAKEISDVVIVSAHWGDENTFEPNDLQKHYAQLFADCGVDVVIGTHPHTIQPVKWIKGNSGNKMLCVYSLGNFIGGMLTTDNAIGGEIKFDFVKKNDKITIENVKWIPTVIHFEGNQDNIIEVRYNYKAYKLSQYSDKLAKKHVLNGYDGNVVNIKYITNKTKEVIDEKYLK